MHDISPKTQIACLRADIEEICRERDKAEAEAQALREEVAALRARVVVADEYAEFEAWLEREKPSGCIGDMERGWMERARLNGKVVSLADIHDCLDAELREWKGDHRKAVERALTDAHGRIRALLGEGKES